MNFILIYLYSLLSMGCVLFFVFYGYNRSSILVYLWYTDSNICAVRLLSNG